MSDRQRKKSPRLLIIGGGSYLGQALLPQAIDHGDMSYTFFQHDPWRQPNGVRLDVRQPESVLALARKVRPAVIVHTVGSNRGADMENVICQGTENVVAAARESQARLIHLSTDSIFRGDQAPYAETAVPDPVNAYGAAKAAAENSVRQELENYVIVRTSLIYGLRHMDHGTAWMAAALQQGRPITLFANQIRNPIWDHTLAAACLELATHEFCGILNVAGRQVLSRATFAQKLLDWWQVPGRENARIAATAQGTWPLDCRLDLTQASLLLRTPLKGVDEVLSAVE